MDRSVAIAVSGGFAIMLFGIFMAILVEQMHEKGIIVDEITTIHTTISVTDLMFSVFFIFALIGLMFILLYRK